MREGGSRDRGSQLPSWASAQLPSWAPHCVPRKPSSPVPALPPPAVAVRSREHPDPCTTLPRVTQHSNRGVSGKKAGKLLRLVHTAGQACIAFPTSKADLFCVCVYPRRDHLGSTSKETPLNFADLHAVQCHRSAVAAINTASHVSFARAVKSRCFSRKIHNRTNGTNQRQK